MGRRCDKQATILALLIIAALPVASAERFLSSMPNATTEDVLTVNAGEQISFTCSHENTVTAVTVWTVSPPVNCSVAVVHLVSQVVGCPPFSFQDISTTSPFTSTAVATANVSMTGAVVTCKDGVGGAAMQVGSSITLCVIDDPPPPQNFQCQPMSGGIVQCSWDRVPQDCTMRYNTYHLIINTTDGNMIDMRISTNTVETFTLLPGQDYVATLITMICGTDQRQSVATMNTFTAQELVTTVLPRQTTITAIGTTKVPTVNACACNTSIGSVVAITSVVTAVVMLTLGVVIGALSAICAVRKKRCSRPATTDYVASSGPVYDEVSQSKGNVQGDLQLEQNIAYGHVKHSV